MKKTVMLSYFAMIICFAMAFLVNSEPERKAVTPARETSSPSTAPKATVALITAPSHTPQAAIAPAASEIEPAPEIITVKWGDKLLELTMDEYLENVVAAEMPASFPLEALKAQAVAARSYAMYCAACHRHAEAQVCTDYSCCQAWESKEKLKELWGENYEKNSVRIKDAVEATAGQYLSYGGEPVFAAFHSSSCGRTQACGEIWSPLPYLLSVSSPENGETVPNYVSRVELSPIDFRDTLLSAAPEADFTGEMKEWVGETERDDSGRVSRVVIGGAVFTGLELRSLFLLRSAAFNIEYTGEGFVFTVTGYGHGVGMSQYGAKAMAASGSDYTQILAHYYPDTILVG